jgi:fumarate hydratase class II
MEAAGVQLDFLSKKDNLTHLVEQIDSLRPDHSNVKRLLGDNNARVYVTNLHPHVGYNRNSKSRNPADSNKIQGYHDSLAASIGDVSKSHFMDNNERLHRITSMILRSAATRTVLTLDHPETRFIEVKPSPKGIVFNEA